VRYISIAFCLLVFAFAPCLQTTCAAKAVSNDDVAALREEIAGLRSEMSAMRNKYEMTIARLEEQVNRLGSGGFELAGPAAVSGHVLATPVDEKERLRLVAAGALGSAAQESSAVSATSAQSVTFKAGELGQQALNPEISMTGDVIAQFRSQDDVRENARGTFRSLGVHGECYLDPDTRFKASFPIQEEGTEICEAYITRVGFSKNLNLTLGKFHQQFGVVGRWHQHALDQVDFPLALRRLFGGPLEQIGVSFDWQLPAGRGMGRELTLQLTHANNDALFAENSRGVPCVLTHYKQFKDLDASTYLEWGVTGMAGTNDRWSVGAAPAISIRDESRPTYALGFDLTRLWEPTDRMRYRNFCWRTEGYYLARDIITAAGDRDTARAWGAYTNLHWKLNRILESGIRLDYYRPDSKPYADVGTPTELYPGALHMVPGRDPYEFQVSPYWTWNQSPWVHYRLEFDYRKGHNMEQDDRRITLQCIWAGGPHLHDRY